MAKSRKRRVLIVDDHAVVREGLRTFLSMLWDIEIAGEAANGTEAVAAEFTRTLFHCARLHMQSFVIYGENACYEWHMENEAPMLFDASPVAPGEVRSVTASRPTTPDRQDLLPPEIARHTSRFQATSAHTHISFEQGGGHHGSHPHMVHEFVRSILEGREPSSGAVTAANWTAAGICAHQSAMAGGEEVVVPAFG